MNLLELTGWGNKVRIAAINIDGSVEIVELRNKITDAGLNMLRNALKGDVSDLEIKYMAWGSDNTTPAGGQTTLVAEFGRKAVTLKDSGTTGVLTTTTYVAPGEGNESTIEEFGWFAGADATGSADTGIMVARVLYSRAKTSLESLQVERDDTISEVT